MKVVWSENAEQLLIQLYFILKPNLVFCLQKSL